LLLRWNARVNLTGARTLDDLLEDHLPDSFALARLASVGAKVVDVGAGGGLPGVPFALLRRDCRVTLVEPRAKRTAFLSTARREVGGSAELEVLRAREEELSAGMFDVATSRATFQPLEWLVLASRLLVPGGVAVVLASGPIEGDREGYSLRDAVSYETGRCASRWAGAFVPRGTIARL
jgi:16S rRNA (guanine527-N7)-methyltransferase